MKKPYIHFDGSARVSITEPFSYVEIDQKEGVKTRTEILDKFALSFQLPRESKMINMQHSFLQNLLGRHKGYKNARRDSSYFRNMQRYARTKPWKNKHF